jgi:hypothetical protein
MPTQLPTETPTTAPPETDLPELPEGLTVPDDAEDAGKLCMIQFALDFHADGTRCGHWAVMVLMGVCGACWRPQGTYACQSCTDVTVVLSQVDVADPQFPLRTICCDAPFLLMHVSPL